jgi:3-methyladenine DNA glycosylase AlkD
MPARTSRSAAPDSDLVDDLRSTLRGIARPERAPAMQAYMKSAMPYLGIPAPALHAACREVFDRHPPVDRRSWISTVRTIWHEASHREERYAALALTGRREYDVHQRIAVLPLYRDLVVSGAWWDLVDPIATQRLYRLLQRDRERMSRAMRTWAGSADMWLRRSAIICQLKMKGETDRSLLYDCIEPSIASREFFLRKAIGWALREYAKTDGGEVRRFVRDNQSRLSGLSRREAEVSL